jgi:small subunit ribosomal protein S4
LLYGKCAIARRSFAPGQHGQGRKKISEYGSQLREKQKAKRFYGVLEGQFRKTFDSASRMKASQVKTCCNSLNCVLTMFVYRMGFAASRAQARQLVTHGHFTINGKKANIPSMTLKAGDTIAVCETSRKSPKFQDLATRPVPSWLTFNAEQLSGTVAQVPARADVDLDVRETLIVELYSK